MNVQPLLAHLQGAIFVGMLVEARGAKGTAALPKGKVPAVNGGHMLPVAANQGLFLLCVVWPYGTGGDEVGGNTANGAGAQCLQQRDDTAGGKSVA